MEEHKYKTYLFSLSLPVHFLYLVSAYTVYMCGYIYINFTDADQVNIYTIHPVKSKRTCTCSDVLSIVNQRERDRDRVSEKEIDR